MTTLPFTLTLASDGEPGSGQGGELVDGFVTRDGDGRPCIRASHLKGLMRDRLGAILRAVAPLRDNSAALLSACFGRAGSNTDDGGLSRLHLTDAVTQGDASPLLITRTALNDLGTVGTSTLRTSEAVAAGTRFRGTATLDDAEPGGVVELAVRLALTAVHAVGGGRTRGAGVCQIELDSETRTPGALLKLLGTALAGGDEAVPSPRESPVAKPAMALDEADATWLQLTFEAAAPVCCPESPTIGLNVLRSGFAIPASAVQGVILSRLPDGDPSMASACFDDDRFRAWPLLPVARTRQQAAGLTATRVARSHRMSKLPGEDGKYLFKDAAIEPYDWREIPGGAPLKAADGVLLRDPSGAVKLWRAADMPRELTAHGVHADPAGKRNLFTVEAVAPLVWAGLVALPPEAADALLASLAARPTVHFGKARSVRGGGLLRAAPIAADTLVAPPLEDGLTGRVLVAQSPLALPDDGEVGAAGDALAELVRQAGLSPVETHAAAGLRFGWNRHGRGRHVGEHRRLRARRCIEPGSVVVLERPLDDLATALLRGVGRGRDAGFGALLPHPGIATDHFQEQPTPPVRSSDRNEPSRLGLRLWEQAGPRGPSPSQIAAVIGRLRRDRDRTLRYLKSRIDRPLRVWRRWQELTETLEDIIRSNDRDTALGALRTWQDLAVANREEDR